MDLFTYLMSKKGQNTQRDLFSYLLGKGSGGGGTYTTYTGTSLNISNSIKAQIKNFMLNSTELTQDGTPSPSSPVDVNVIKGNNNIKITDGIKEQNYPISLSSKNLFDLKNENFIKRIDTTTLSISNDGFTVNKTDTLLQERITVYKQLKPNTTYTISTVPTSEKAKYLGAYLAAVDEISTSAYPSENAGLSNVATTNSYGILAIIFYFSTSLSGNYIVENIQLEEGSTATTYEPYYNIEYCKIGDYADQIFKNTIDSEFYDSTLLENEWYLKKNIGKVVFDGSENWLSSGTFSGFYTYYLTLTNAVNVGQDASPLFKSDKFHYVNGTSQAKEGGAYMVAKNFLIFVTENTVSGLKTWMGTNNVILYYQLATPTYIHISQTDYPVLKQELDNLYNNAESYDGQTNITQINDDLPFNISVDVKVANL